MTSGDGQNTEKNTHDHRDNLRPPWKPGESGNPGGRPRKKMITEMYERILNDPIAIAAIEVATMKALKGGNMAMVLQLKEMADRTEGKVSLPIEADVSVNLADAIAEARRRAGK